MEDEGRDEEEGSSSVRVVWFVDVVEVFLVVGVVGFIAVMIVVAVRNPPALGSANLEWTLELDTEKPTINVRDRSTQLMSP